MGIRFARVRVKPVQTRHLARGTACVMAAILSIPVPAAAQRQSFFEAVAGLADAAEGIYGDEGARIGAVLDAMSQALDAWERDGALEPVPAAQAKQGLEAAASGMPLIPLAAYRRGFEQLAKGNLRQAVAELRRAASDDRLVAGAPVQSASLRRAIAALEDGRL